MLVEDASYCHMGLSNMGTLESPYNMASDSREQGRVAMFHVMYFRTHCLEGHGIGAELIRTHVVQGGGLQGIPCRETGAPPHGHTDDPSIHLPVFVASMCCLSIHPLLTHAVGVLSLSRV